MTTDRTIKVLLLAIALGLWANVVGGEGLKLVFWVAYALWHALWNVFTR